MRVFGCRETRVECVLLLGGRGREALALQRMQGMLVNVGGLMKRIVLFASIALSFSMNGAVAQERYSFGIGERYDETPQPWNPCGTNPNVVAQDTCSVHLPTRTIERFGYTVDPVNVWSGNRCGYTKYATSCYGMPDIAENRVKKFVIGEKNADYKCGADAMAIARDFCTVKGPNPTAYPFSLRRTNTVDGNRCGYNTYEVMCRKPFPPRVETLFEPVR